MCNSHCTYLCLPPSTLHLLLSTLGHASSNPSHRPPASTSDHSPSLSLSLPLPLSLFLSLSLFPPISRILSVGTSASLSLSHRFAIYVRLARSYWFVSDLKTEGRSIGRFSSRFSSATTTPRRVEKLLSGLPIRTRKKIQVDRTHSREREKSKRSRGKRMTRTTTTTTAATTTTMAW